MNIYISPKIGKDGSLKFICPVKSDKFLMILKFKMKISDNKPPETISSIGSSLNPRLNHTLERIFNEPMIPTLTSTSKNEMNLTTNNFLEMIKENSELASRDIS
jgi:hypothetical protein